MKTFIFDDELYINENLTTIDGYLWIGTSLGDLIDQVIDDSVCVDQIDNLNLYAFYDLTTNDIWCNGTYYLGDEQKEYVFPIDAAQKSELIEAFQAYCQERYGCTCLEFVNTERKEYGMEPIPMGVEQNQER